MRVSNPLTIISIFAGLAEIMATTALLKLPIELQGIFIYFVMGFPTLLVILFFIVLVFKNKALYAPSDFTNQEHYLELNDLKRSIETNVSAAFDSIEGVSADEKIRLRKHVDSSLQSSFRSTRREQILNYLEEKSGTTKEICEITGIHPSYGSLILKNLEDEDAVKKKKEGRSYIWSLNA
ncbi:helix-turn-helix domain-containing protein [Gilvimarinus agarilyticus]|uniref:helix-turn-helix transcriptional regulator n=1 Tax=Gilvimarinus sp. 2_MG-2023 TaxID=3062666 RepID=UPI001C09DDBC|nr:helix-turn-helix domain-containing protein [Gilvimarinus sp. 2_MG-2023]MBU2887647.1 helix-turn-helix domain-containing protein [Gilvimarinus agarilyticus]MDO6572296.1 helix-turn-helix domain-containing protein [Gilvimarinus sp. 2_MG-2023]